MDGSPIEVSSDDEIESESVKTHPTVESPPVGKREEKEEEDVAPSTKEQGMVKSDRASNCSFHLSEKSPILRLRR
jgi:hypothetical protein